MSEKLSYYKRKKAADPDFLRKNRERQRNYYHERKETDPNWLEIKNDYQKSFYQKRKEENPAAHKTMLNKQRLQSRKYYKNRKATDPEWYEQRIKENRDAGKAYYHANKDNPEYMARQRLAQKRYRDKKKKLST